MKPDGHLRLLSQVRDLEIVDCEDRMCGIADEIELAGTPGEPLRIAALLVGPGAYGGRLPKWAFRLITAVAGRRVTRVPWEAVDIVAGDIRLKVKGEELGLRAKEAEYGRRIPRIPAL
jgi:hypothetical protein